MPRTTRARTSLPGHSKSARPKAEPTADDDVNMIGEQPTASSVQAVNDFSDAEESAEAAARPVNKQTKVEKLAQRREALLQKIMAGQSPYSKSTKRRQKRAARPSENLVTDLNEVDNVLQEVEAQVEELVPEQVAEEEEMNQEANWKVLGGKGQEKLTAKKRQRVLSAEASRMPAILSNKSFAANPFATIREHTLNTMKAQQAAASSNTKSKNKAGR